MKICVPGSKSHYRREGNSDGGPIALELDAVNLIFLSVLNPFSWNWSESDRDRSPSSRSETPILS